VAKETGLINQRRTDTRKRLPVGAYLDARKAWGRTVAVNVSPASSEQGNLTDTVGRRLKRTAFIRTGWNREFTESMADRDPSKSGGNQWGAAHDGMKLAIDDFGTDTPTCRADPAAVRHLQDRRSSFGPSRVTSRAPAMVEMILANGETLGLETVAEGV